MKELFIKDLRKDMELMDFFMVKSIAIKIGSNGKRYLDLVLGDNSGELTGKKWDVADTEEASLNEIKERDIVRVKANITEWAGQLQIRVTRIRKAVESDGLVIGDFVKAAPEDTREMYAYILEKAQSLKDDDLRKLAVRLMEDNKKELLYYPAASKNHHAELGGLLYHMKRMLMNGERVCEVYTGLNRDLVVTGVIMHDIQKIEEIDAGEDGIASGYSFEGQMLGHLVMGIKYIDRLALELEISAEKRIMLEHMILSHHYEPEFGSPKKPLFPEAEVLHYLDILDARMYDMEAALQNIDKGTFSDRVWTLENRRIYKPEEF